jgi:hypothetical protein
LETVDSDAFLRGSWVNRKLLFTISTEEASDCTPLQIDGLLRICRKDVSSKGCVCAAVLDGALAGLRIVGALSLLLAGKPEAGQSFFRAVDRVRQGAALFFGRKRISI